MNSDRRLAWILIVVGGVLTLFFGVLVASSPFTIAALVVWVLAFLAGVVLVRSWP